jgi:hypothetical protein
VITDKAGLLRIVDDLSSDLSKLQESHRQLHESAVRLGKLAESLNKKVTEVVQLSSRGQTPQLMLATRQMQEMNMSFNLQYLQLQQKMQSENRQFTTISNVMKTKHDTTKAAINNIR